MGQLDNKICLVTGSSRGIGKAIVQLFLEHGAIVYANTRSEQSLNSLKEDIESEYHDRLFNACFDVNDTSLMKSQILDIKKNHQRIDVWVNNAAVVYNERIGMISRAHMEEMFQTNVLSVIESMQIVSRIMQRQKSGSIINIASIVGQYGDAGQCAYSATKGAIIALTRSASKELAPMNIRVNAVSPGLTNTDVFRNASQDKLEERIADIGMGRVADPSDIAEACVFFASDSSRYITGQILGVNGGSKI